MEAWVAALVPEIEPVEEIKAAMDAARYRARHADEAMDIAAE
tara:strand:+ start:3304 stop:3429 length:126 start_codon:yes stop_codon:yes gene_type:complete